MRRALPPSNALEVFEAAARLGSFAKAAEELNITPSAVSHRVKALESQLGVRFFDRKPQRLILTEAGRDFRLVVGDALDRIAVGLERLADRRDQGALAISASIGFASKWLLPRLGRFRARHPAIDLRLSAVGRMIDFAREDVDLAIRYTEEPDLEGFDKTPLRRETRSPVCAPALAGKLRAPADLGAVPLIHFEHRRAWAPWLAHAGVEGLDLSRGLVLDQSNLVIDAAVLGLGVALVRTSAVAHDLLAGRLVKPFAVDLELSRRFWLITPSALARRAKTCAFRDWVLEEIRIEDEALAALERS